MSRFANIFTASLFFTSALSQAASPSVVDEPNEFEYTISMLKQHFGERLKESDYLCKLPPTSGLKPPTTWDCRTWSVNNVRLGQSLRMDRASYQALPNGKVISRSYSIENDCSRALSVFFALQSTVFTGVQGTAKGGEISTEQVLGSIRMDKTFNGKEPSEASAVIDFDSGKCSFLFWTQPKR